MVREHGPIGLEGELGSPLIDDLLSRALDLYVDGCDRKFARHRLEQLAEAAVVRLRREHALQLCGNR